MQHQILWTTWRRQTQRGGVMITLKGWKAAALTSSWAEGSTLTSGMPAATRYTSMMVCTGMTLAPTSATRLRSSEMCRLQSQSHSQNQPLQPCHCSECGSPSFGHLGALHECMHGAPVALVGTFPGGLCIESTLQHAIAIVALRESQSHRYGSA